MMEGGNQISATEFKKHFLQLVDQVKNLGSSFIITKRKSPVAKVVPMEPSARDDSKSYFGFMKGTAKIADDIVNCSSEEDWEANDDR